MSNFECKWLTPIINFDDYENNWEKYNKKLYEVFIKDFIATNLYFKRKKVQIRINPKQDNYEHAFIHLTCTSTKMSDDPNDRIPDLRRCERIEWNRKIIENYNCIQNCIGCKKILYYEHMYNNNVRINLFFPDARFKVIIEKREKYFLLVTGYYIEFDRTIEKEYERYNKFEQQKTPLD